MYIESDFSRHASPQSDSVMMSRKVGKYYWFFIGAVAVFVLFFILISSIPKRPSPARIGITVAVVVLYILLAYLCRPKNVALDPSEYLLPITGSPLTWSHTSSMRREAAELSATIDSSIPVFLYSRKIGDEISSPRQVICSVCLALLQEGEPVRQLEECNHIFHADCIATWLPLHMSCPICRSEVNMAKYVHAAEARNPFESSGSPARSGSLTN